MTYYRFMTSANHRKHQRAINKVFRAVNKSICDDELWLGRFAVVQEATYFFKYDSDYWQRQKYPAEYYMVVEYHFVDKKTGRISRSCRDVANNLEISNKLWQQMNDFIVVECNDDVWGATEQPTRDNAVDYRKVAVK